MNTSEQSSDQGSSRSAGGYILSGLAWLLLVVQIVFSLITAPLLPDIVPSHWDAAGRVNGTMPRLGFVLTFVGISFGMLMLFQIIRAVVKRADQDKARLGVSIISVVTLFPLSISLATQVITTGVILHW